MTLTLMKRGSWSRGMPILAAAILVLLPFLATPADAGASNGEREGRVSPVLKEKIRDAGDDQSIPVIIQTGAEPSRGHFARLFHRGGSVKGRHGAFHGYSANVPAGQIAALAEDPEVTRISFDAPVQAALDVASLAVRADVAFTELGGLDGSGIGIAVIDTGVQLHADLMRDRRSPQAIEVEVVGHEPGLADYFGHGTAVAGVINGNGLASSGYDSFRTFKGLAPGAQLISLRALAADGTGRASDIIMAIDWVLQHRDRYNIRVINLSLGHPVFESYETDPLCRAARAAVEAGVVVVAAAGNGGRIGSGFGTITSPGNEPSVITVGAMDDSDTAAREDDVLAVFSAKGPTLVDHVVKPDLVAPGAFIVSLRAQNSYIDTSHPEFRLNVGDYKSGDFQSWMDGDYTVLSGTSLAAPMVAATAALMLQREPGLNPATIKARLMLSASKDDLMMFETGAGYLDVAAALQATGVAMSALSPTAVVNPDGTVTIEETADSWGEEWQQGLIWGFRQSYYTLDSWDGEWQQGLIWGFQRSYTTLAATENNEVTASGLLWGGNGARYMSDLGVVENSGLLWGGN